MKLVCIHIVLFISAIKIFGCATISNPKTIAVTINSNPQGADVYFDGSRVGRTPLLTTASNKHPITVSLKKEGYEDITKLIDVHTAGGYLVADCFLPPIYGCVWIALDMATKNANALNETQLDFNLDPVQSK
jgi:hypothetical protein